MKEDIKVLGIDLAKNIFQLHGNNRNGKRIYTKRVKREDLLSTLSNMPSCLIGIEACGGSHYWAREFIKLGHEVKIIAPQFVKPFVMSSKNDANDAKAIATAVVQPSMRFVPIKTVEQQDMQLIHRVRSLAIKHRSAKAHQIRGLLAESGIVIPLGISHVLRLPFYLNEHKDKLSPLTIEIFERLHEQLKCYSEEVEHYTHKIEQQVKQEAACQQIMKIEGLGPISASAIVSAVGDVHVFKNGRQMAAWIGLVPKQHSSGNKIILGGITKRGDSYLRTLLIHGARSAIRAIGEKCDKKSIWLKSLVARVGVNKAAVALANKNARIVWAMLSTGECYRAA